MDRPAEAPPDAGASAALPEHLRATLRRRGWVRLPRDPALLAWSRAVRPAALATSRDPELRRRWLRSDGTWFVGVNVLGNGPDGAIPARGVPPLPLRLRRFLAAGPAPVAFDRGQVSILHPGYPRRGEGESEAAFRFRRHHYAAHVDGFARMPGGRRHLSECHRFLLGIPLGAVAEGASPLLVWEGSQAVFRSELAAGLAAVPPARWREVDCTEAYLRARRRCLAGGRPVAVHARPGEAWLVHRLALHGIAPWTAAAAVEPRAVVYFRPVMTGGGLPERWLRAP